MLTSQQQAQVREDFEAWSGGSAPSDMEQIFDYVHTAMAVEDVADADVTEWLVNQIGDWL